MGLKNWRLRYRRVIVGSVALLSIVMHGLTLTSAFAASDTNASGTITMTASVGFAGYYSETDWIPAYIEVHNTGAATSGEFVLEVSGNLGQGRIQDGKMEWKESIPSGWHHYTLSLPGNIFNRLASPELQLRVQNRVVAPTYLTGNRIENTDLVAVLSTQANRAQFLTGTTGPPSSNPVLPIAFNPTNLPDKPDLLNMLTAVVADPTTLGQLAPSQARALWAWVRMGGMLFVTGVEWGNTSPPLPIVAGPNRWVSGFPLTQFVGGSDTAAWSLEMEGQGLRPGATLLIGSKTAPLAASFQLGRGHLVQTSFDPIQTRLLQWPSNVSLWTNLLKSMDSGNLAVDRNLLDTNGLLTLTNASDALSPLRIPSLRFWGVVFGVYVFLVGPVCFFLLTRFRKQSLAWGILPALSIVTTISIYIFGESLRPTGTLTEGVAVLDLVGNSEAESTGISAFMSPTTMTASATSRQRMIMLPIAQQGIRHMGTATVTQSPSSSTISFSNVGRYGIRYVYATGSFTGQGEFDASLDSTYYFTGTLTNHTKYTMRDVAVFWNNRMYPVGTMPPNATKTIDAPLAPANLSDSAILSYSNYNREVSRGIGRALGNYSAGLINTQLNQQTALIVATTNNRVPTLPLLQGIHYGASDTLTLVRQFVSVADFPLG